MPESNEIQTIRNSAEKRRRRRCGATALSVLGGVALAVSLPLSGCNILGPAIYLIHGPEKAPPLHRLDPKRRTVVFVDDRRNKLPRRSLRQVMAEKAQDLLLKERCVEAMIDAKAALAVTARDKATEPMNIAEIAKAAQAEVIVYATVDQFVLSVDGQTFSPSITLRIKVVDAVNEARMWPTEKDGHTLVVNIPMRQGFVPQNQSEQMKAEVETAEATGLALAQLFYEHEVQASPSRSSPDGL